MVSHADDLGLDDVVSMSNLDSLSHEVIQSFRFSHADRCFSQSDAVVIKVNQVVCFLISFFYYFYYNVVSHADELSLADVVSLSDLTVSHIHVLVSQMQ